MRCETTNEGDSMTKQDLIDAAILDAIDLASSLPHWANTVGIRYDNKTVAVGNELEASVLNTDREDGRDFPAYDPDAERAAGTSCYLVANQFDDEDDITSLDIGRYVSGQTEAAWCHCSLVIGKRTDDFCEDLGEVILAGCEVVKVYW
jgi:hypothetical protein